MTYRTIEEKFLADYEKLERENARLEGEVNDLKQQLEGLNAKTNITLDVAVRAAGRKEMINNVIYSWRTCSAINNDFEDWVRYMADGNIPKGVSFQEFIKYFEDELVEMYEEAYDKEYAEKQRQEEANEADE